MTTPRFREEQAFRRWWIWLLLLPVAGLQWWGFYQQIVRGQPWGNNPAPDWMLVALWLAVGIGLPLFFLYIRLIVTVSDEAVDIHFRPLTRCRIPLAEIADVQARRYSPLREYGGWGIRGLSNQRAYSVSGDRGVALVLTSGRQLLIGSQRAGDLALAITAAQESHQRRLPTPPG